jgi:TolC family type I secretion outer membrane protein
LARVLKSKFAWLVSVAIYGGCGVYGAATADTLREAMLSAYRSNPDLQSQRAFQRATDELVPSAKSGWRPTIVGGASASEKWTDNDVSPSSSDTSFDLQIELSQPIFRGFKTVEGVKSAKAQVRAGQQQLLAVEQQVLLRVVVAYMDVIRDQKILGLRKRNVTNLQKQVNATTARFEAGEVTTTDVSQARARSASAQAGAALALSNLNSSKAAYAAVVGREPNALAVPGPAKIPRSLQNALASSESINPDILGASALHEAALHDVEVAKGDLLPEITLEAAAGRTFSPASGVDRSDFAQIQGVVRVPLYQAGREYSAVRKAKQSASEKQINIVSATRAVRQDVTSSWSVLSATTDSIVAARAQVDAAQKALDGLNQEYLVGSRSTIDVLNAEQEVLNARIELVSAEHDQVVASYQLLAAIGELTARNLGLPGPYYDAEAHYQSVKDKWIGLDAETVE